MLFSRPVATDLWTIVLAGGAGRRLAAMTGGIPKQYWHPAGGPSLLEATLARLQPLATPEQTLTIVDASHRRYLQSLDPDGLLGEVIYQPSDRGTAAGVLLPLAAVATASPHAIVVITPSDHGVEDDECFRHGLQRAAARIDSMSADVVLFGVQPAAVTADFGWITPTARGAFADGNFRGVASFVEKPPLHEALRLFSAGAVWNTMVLVARVSSLLDLFRQHLPFHTDFALAAQELDGSSRDVFLQDWYPELPPADFCRDVLTPSPNLCLYTWPEEMGWSDLGTPDRLEEWLSSRLHYSDHAAAVVTASTETVR